MRPLSSLWGALGSLRGALGSLWGALGSLWASTWLPLRCPWIPLGLPWVPLGRPRVPLGVRLAPFGVSLGPFGAPLDPFGAPLGPFEAYSAILSKLDVQFRAFGSQVRSLSTKYNLAGFIRGFRRFRGNGSNRAGPGLGSTGAGGQDDGSLHKLPQNTDSLKLDISL